MLCLRFRCNLNVGSYFMIKIYDNNYNYVMVILPMKINKSMNKLVIFSTVFRLILLSVHIFLGRWMLDANLPRSSCPFTKYLKKPGVHWRVWRLLSSINSG